jgi:hypothetical protein
MGGAIGSAYRGKVQMRAAKKKGKEDPDKRLWLARAKRHKYKHNPKPRGSHVSAYQDHFTS